MPCWCSSPRSQGEHRKLNLKGWRIEIDDYDNESTLRNGCVVDDEQIGGDQEDTGDVAHLKEPWSFLRYKNVVFTYHNLAVEVEKVRDCDVDD